MEGISPDRFYDDPELADWRVVPDGAHARYRAADFAAALVLVNAIGVLADAADHHPDIDIRYSEVRLRLVSHDVGAVTVRDLELARQISVTAREHGATTVTHDDPR